MMEEEEVIAHQEILITEEVVLVEVQEEEVEVQEEVVVCLMVVEVEIQEEEARLTVLRIQMHQFLLEEITIED